MPAPHRFGHVDLALGKHPRPARCLFPSFRSVTLALLAVVSIAASTPRAAAQPTDAREPVEVLIVRPTEATPVVGKVDFSFLVSGAEDDEIELAEIFLDGRRVMTLSAPPWSRAIDAGGDLGARVVEVQVTLRDGRTARAARTTRPVQFDEVDVRLVNLAVTVTDQRGRPIEDLTRGEFEVLDEGRRVDIERWDASPAGLAVALLIDTSLTMRGSKLEEAKDAARDFVQALGESDRVALMTFSKAPVLRSPLTEEKEGVLEEIASLDVALGGTALYDAVFEAASHMQQAPNGYRRVLIVLSDGRDESGDGYEPGSFHNLDESIQNLHGHDAIAYSIGFGAEIDNALDFDRRMTLAQVLEGLASSTGGRFERLRKWKSLKGLYREILDELRLQYGIAYSPPEAAPGETWRKIEVRVSRPGADVRSREGYFVR